MAPRRPNVAPIRPQDGAGPICKTGHGPGWHTAYDAGAAYGISRALRADARGCADARGLPNTRVLPIARKHEDRSWYSESDLTFLTRTDGEERSVNALGHTDTDSLDELLNLSALKDLSHTASAHAPLYIYIYTRAQRNKRSLFENHAD